MAYIIKKTAPVRTPAPEGTFQANCIRFIDLGTQTDTWQGKPKTKPKIMLIWELIGANRDDGTPHIVSEKYTASFTEKANLFQVLKSWFGAEVDGEEFDLTQVVGKPCFINIAHSTSKDGSQVYANVQSVMALPAGLTVAPPQSTPKAFELSNPDWELFAEFSDWTRDQIRKSPEYAALDLPENTPPPLAPETSAATKQAKMPINGNMGLIQILENSLKTGAMTLTQLFDLYEVSETERLHFESLVSATE